MQPVYEDTFDVPTQYNLRRDNDILANIGSVANLAILHDMGEVPNPGTRANFARFVGVRGFVDEVGFLSAGDMDSARAGIKNESGNAASCLYVSSASPMRFSAIRRFSRLIRAAPFLERVEVPS